MTLSADVAIPSTAISEGRSTAGESARGEGGRRVGVSLDLPDAFRLLAERALRLIGAQDTRLIMWREGAPSVVGAAGTRSADDPLLPDELALCESARRVGAAESSRDTTRAAGAPEGIAIPMIADGSPIGILLATSASGTPFGDAERAQLAWLADLGALTVRNAQLVSRAERSAAEARALAEIVQNINQSLELDRVFDLVARHAMKLLGGRASRLGMLDGDTLVLVAAAGPSNQPIGTRVLLDGTIGGECIRLGHATSAVLDARSTHWWSVANLPADCRSVVSAPLLVGDRALGVVLVYDGADREFDEEDERLLAALASQASIAIENARLYHASVRTMRHASVLATAARSLALNVSTAATYDDIGRIARTSLGADGVTIYLADSESGRVEIAHAQGSGSSSVPMLAISTFWESSGGTAVRGGEAHFRSDVATFSDHTVVSALVEHGISSLALLPLVVEGRPRGLLVLRFRARQDFPDDQRFLLLDFATHVAVAVRNARLFADLALAYEAEKREREQAEAAAEIARLALRERDVKDMADDLLSTISRTVGVHGIALGVLMEDGVVRCLSTRGGIDAILSAEMPLASGASEMAVPLSAAGRLLGVVRAVPEPGKSLEPREIAALTQLAAPTALALDTLLLRIEERRQQGRQRMLAEALQTMDQPVFIFSTDRRVRFANAAATRQYGYANDELLDMTLSQMTVRPRGQREEDDIAETLDASGVWSAERVHRRKDGSEFPCWMVMSGIRDIEGRPIGLVGVMRDLTDERRVDEQLRQSEKLAALGELVAGVAHEVNNPLTGISAMTQLLLEEPLEEEQLESLRLVKREADRAVAVIRDLLTFARKTGPRVVSVDFNQLIEQTLRLRTYALRTAGVQTDLHPAPDLAPVFGDDRLLQQVLLNLIVNAEHAMTGSARRVLTIRTANHAGRVIVEIADTGVGMTPDVQKRIFEPFFTTKPEGRGTGLGLSVSYGIVQTHGGTLTVHTAPGAGATFRMSLPVAGSGQGPNSNQRRT